MKHNRRWIAVFALSLAALGARQARAQDAPPTRARFQLTATEVLSAGPTGPELLPPVEGFYYRVAHGTVLKKAGGAFTVSNPGHFLQLQYENTASTPVQAVARPAQVEV